MSHLSSATTARHSSSACAVPMMRTSGGR
jgi:hypothetical protein